MKTNKFLILWASIFTMIVLLGAGYQSLMVNPDNGQVKQNVNFMGTALLNYSAIATQLYASAVIPVGMVSTSGNQTIGGTKTFSETITGSVSGNAGTVTNGVYTTGAGTVYLAPTGSAAGLTSFPTLNQSTTGNAGTVTNGVVTTGSYSDPSWLAISKAKVGLSAVLNAIQLYKDGSDIASIAAGDVLYYNGTTWTRLGKDVGKFLKSGDSPSWDTPAGTVTFLGLTDTPDAYTSKSGQYVRVNTGETALEFGNPAGAGTVTSVSVTTANGVSGSVATADSTPAITLSLGAITPSTVNGVTLSGSSTPTLAVTGTTTVSGSNTGDQTNIAGNAATATTLATARAINGVDFNGSQAITIPSNIAPSTSGNVMVSNGTIWTSAAFSALPSGTQGDIIYYNGTAWVVLNAGTSGQFLKTMGAAANPAWGTPAGSGNTTSPGTTTDGYIPQWDGTNSNTLKNGYSAVATATPSTLVLRDINSSITAQAFYGDGSHLTGVSALPSQTGNSGKYLTTNGSAASWATVAGATQAIYGYIQDATITEAMKGALITNALYSNESGWTPATVNVTYTFAAGLSDGFWVDVANEVASDAYTSLFLHMDDTGLTDEKGNTMTLNGGVARSDTQSKFGGYSAIFDGNGDYLSAPSGSSFAFGTGNFTIDFWIYATTLSAYNHVWDSRISDADTYGFSIGYTADGKVNIWTDGAFKIQTNTTIGTGAWNHIALERNGNVFKIYINGTADAQTWTGTPNFTNQTCTIGKYYGGTADYMIIGYLDEFRVSKGVAKYAGNFSVETAEYPSPTTANIIITPASGEQLPGTAAADSTLISSIKGDVKNFHNTGYLWISKYTTGTWVDGL